MGLAQPHTGNVLAIDQGTSATKALVVSVAGEVLASAQVAVRPRYGSDGLVEQDPHELLESVVEAGAQALAQASEPVDGIGLANQGETVLAWKPDTGAPLTDAIVWQDRRAQSICTELGDAAEHLAALTGLTLDPYFAAPKMAWIRRNLTTEGVVTTTDAWLVHRLTGAFVTDASTASRTMLMDLDRVEWSDEALSLFGLASERMPTIVDAAGEIGSTGRFGASADLPVTGLLVDQQAALLGEGCVTPGSAKCTFGTGAFLLANTGGEPRRSTGGLVSCVAWRLDSIPTYCLDGQVYTVASAVRWLTDIGIVGGAADLDRVGATVDGTGGVSFVPAFTGLAAPWWRSDTRAAIAGLSLSTERGHLVHALCEGVAAQVAALVAAAGADLGSPLTALKVDGGLTRSTLLMQTHADLLQIPIEVFASPDATALGVAAAARQGLVGHSEPIPAVPDPAAVYWPAIGADEADERLDRHRRFIDALIEAQT